MPTQDTTTSPSGLDVNKILSELEVPFPPDQVQWRVTNTTNDKKRGQVVPYADPRAYTDRLNALFSPQGWTREYKIETLNNITRVKKGESLLSGKVLVTCTVTIIGLWSHSGTGEEWMKEDFTSTLGQRRQRHDLSRRASLQASVLVLRSGPLLLRLPGHLGRSRPTP